MARELAKEGHDPIFVTRDKAFVRSRIEAAGFSEVEGFENDSDEAEAILRRGPGLAVFDVGATAHEVVAAIKEIGCFIVTFEDLGDGRYLADLVIDANLTENSNPRKMATPTRYLLGPDYAVISQKATAAKKKRRGSRGFFTRDGLRKIIVTCGGSDPAGVTPRVVEALSLFDGEIDIELILGPAFSPKDELDRALLKSSRIFSIVEAPDNFHDRMRRADLGILSGGVTLFEAAYLGLPATVIAQNATQLKNLPAFESNSGIVSLGLAAHNPFPNLSATIRSIESKLGAMAAAQERYVDGKGLDRVVAAIRETLGR